MLNAIKNWTPLQWLGVLLVLNGVVTGSVNELTDLFGNVWAKHLLSVANMGSSFCGGLVTMFGGQASQGDQVKAVLAMPGVEHMDINEKANATLAAIAIDPKVNKIRPTAEAMDAVTATAKG